MTLRKTKLATYDSQLYAIEVCMGRAASRRPG